MARLAGQEDIILPYPLQNMLTRAMRTAAAKGGDAGFLSLWAGTGAPQARAMAAGALVARLAEEKRDGRGEERIAPRREREQRGQEEGEAAEGEGAIEGGRRLLR